MGQHLDNAVKFIKEKYGAGSVMKFSDQVAERVPVISTGCMSIDLVTGVGGLPRGRITEIFGQPGGGKTTLMLHTVAQAQRAGMTVAYIDAENALDAKYAKILGVDVDAMIVSQPDYGEQGLEIAEILIRSGEVKLVVVDSVDALVPLKVIEGEHQDQHVGLLPRMMSQACRKFSAVVRKGGVALVFINQERSKINMTGYGRQDEKVTSGGVGLKFYSSMRINVKWIGQLKDDDAKYGAKTQIEVVKNKQASPFKSCITELIYGKGFNLTGDILDRAVECDIIEKSGAWYKFNGHRMSGRRGVVEWLEKQPEMLKVLRSEILTAKGVGVMTPEEEEEVDDGGESDKAEAEE